MPDPMLRPDSIPHLDEAYRLAQFVAPDRETAADAVARAYSAAGEPTRFGVLRGVIEACGPLRVATGEPGAEDPRGEVGPSDDPWPVLPASGDPGAGPARPAMFHSLAGRSVRDRLLPEAFASLDPFERVVCWLDATGLSNPADAGAVLGMHHAEARAALSGGRRRLTEAVAAGCDPSTAALARSADDAEPIQDALRRVLEPMLDRAPASLVARLLPEPRPAASRRGGSAIRVAAFVAMAALVGYGVRSFRPEPQEAPPREDLLQSAVVAASRTELSFRTTSPEQAEVFIRDRIGWRVVLPTVDGSPLEGVGIASLGGQDDAPVVRFGGARPVTMVVVTYAFLDRVAPRLTVDRAILEQIGVQDRFAVFDEGPLRAVVFRNRDDIFVAITSGDARDLESAIGFPG